MAKKATAKAKAKDVKKAKFAAKNERKAKKKSSKAKDEPEDDQNLEEILDKMQREWEESHAVTEELVEGPPSRRASATLTPCPSGNYLWCIGGEFFSEDGKAYFYNDVFRYTPEKDEWRKFVSPTCPGPRSAHAVVASPASGGKLFLFGGEFSSLYQNSFHHYRDFWCFDLTTHAWDRIDTKVRPSARSGHRMAMWKHYVVLFGGFYDPGIITRYLNDLWLFDTQEYMWQQIEFKDADRRPSPRSGFSFLSTPDGILLHGGYYKEYSKGKRPVGVMLDDTWFLRMALVTPPEGTKPKNFEPLSLKWERRKRPSTAYAPSLRSGCTMALWPARNMGVLFGGVTDEDTSEETLDSVFHNDLYGYQIAGTGKWVSLLLRKPKKKAAAKKKKAAPTAPRHRDGSSGDEGRESSGEDADPRRASTRLAAPSASAYPEIDPDDPMLTVPLPRYNAMLAVLRNTLYIYGGIFERGSREYTLDDFYSLALDKMDRYVCLKPSGVDIPAEGDVESSSDEEDDDEGSSEESGGEDGEEAGMDVNMTAVDEDESGEESAVEEKKKKTKGKYDDDGFGEDAEKLKRKTKKGSAAVEQRPLDEEQEVEIPDDPDSLRLRAAAFMGVTRDTTRSPEDVLSTPLPGETLAVFYARSREHWAAKARDSSDNRGKMLRRDGFSLAQERYQEYKPILKEVERILAEAGLDDDEIKRGVADGPSGKGAGESRNRR